MRLTAAAARPYWALAAATLAAAPAAAVLYRYNPLQVDFYPRCLLFVFTGVLCPGCGVLRASHALLHGHLFTALGFNALFVLILPFLLYAIAAQVLQAAYGRPVLRTVPLSGRNARTLLWVFVAFTLLRNIPLYPFDLLAP